MRNNGLLVFAVIATVTMLGASGAWAQYGYGGYGSHGDVPFGGFSIGYSNVQMQHTSGLFYSHDGVYVDGDFEWPTPTTIPLYLGFGVTGSAYFDDHSVQFPNDNDPFDHFHLYSNLGLFELEPRVGIRLGRSTGFFAFPRIGAGLLINSYAIDQSQTVNGNTFINTRYFTGAAFEVRPAIQVGYSWGPSAVGIEASYMYAIGDFGSLGRNAQEIRIGPFFQMRF